MFEMVGSGILLVIIIIIMAVSILIFDKDDK